MRLVWESDVHHSHDPSIDPSEEFSDDIEGHSINGYVNVYHWPELRCKVCGFQAKEQKLRKLEARSLGKDGEKAKQEKACRHTLTLKQYIPAYVTKEAVCARCGRPVMVYFTVKNYLGSIIVFLLLADVTKDEHKLSAFMSSLMGSFELPRIYQFALLVLICVIIYTITNFISYVFEFWGKNYSLSSEENE